jgi:hypothetical protein
MTFVKYEEDLEKQAIADKLTSAPADNPFFQFYLVQGKDDETTPEMEESQDWRIHIEGSPQRHYNAHQKVHAPAAFVSHWKVSH